MAPAALAWTEPAKQDLRAAVEYLAREAQAPLAAARLLDRIEAAAASLSEFPSRGRIVPELGLPRRELLVEGYRLVYREHPRVEILGLLHGRRDFLAAWRQRPR